MVRGKVKWKFVILFYLVLLNVFTKSLPINTVTTPSTIITETEFTNSNLVTRNVPDNVEHEENVTPSVERSNITKNSNISRDSLLRNVRPGQQVRQYAVSLTFNEDEFIGRAVIDVTITDAMRGESLIFHFDDIEIENVQTGVFTIASAVDADFNLDDGLLEIEPTQDATSFIVIVEYTGKLSNTGRGLYLGEGHDMSYIGMNLHPTNARRVFPCMDEPSEPATVTFTFNDVEYNNIITNTILDDRNTNADEHQFRPLLGPVHTWGMIAHNFINLNIPTPDVLLAGRPGITNQDAQASIAINAYFAFLNEWTDTPFFEIVMNQANRLTVLALPDVDRDWNTLSTIGIWEPYILMQNVASIKQRKTVLVKIAEAMAKQWFGYVIHPQNWRHSWVISGFASHAAYEAVKSFQTSATGATDVTLLDMNTLFVTDVIQEALLQDSYTSSLPLLSDDDLFDEDTIRDYLFSVQRLKAPALMHMIRLILGDEDHDAIQVAAQALLTGRALETVSSQNFIDAMRGGLTIQGNEFIEDIEEFLLPWITNNGYPVINVVLRQDRVFLTQERFGFSPQQNVNFEVPITFTTSANPNFDDDNIRPIILMDSTTTLDLVLDEEDWILFNIQGQGFYRVNYDPDLWERIIEALDDEETREEIHPLNRATLVDDALNLARAGKLDYDIAFRVVLTMEHETEYAVWKAFVRNMDFIRKRLVALVTEDEDLDPDIYLRMVRRTIGALEDELGFYPDPLVAEPAMDTLTRGLVMDHACRANYDPCIAAAQDWFFDPNANDPVVNPNIPYEIRPAVYCTMVREGDETVIEALNARLEDEASHYERVVILEALACSQDEDYINELLMETITPDNPYMTEERVKIFKAVAESSYQNARLALGFISNRAIDIREWYGGDEKLEEIIFHLADNMAEAGLHVDFEVFVNAQNNELGESQFTANRAVLQANENRRWNNNLMDYVYEWIDENDAPTLAVSLVLVGITFIITLFNN